MYLLLMKHAAWVSTTDEALFVADDVVYIICLFCASVETGA